MMQKQLSKQLSVGSPEGVAQKEGKIKTKQKRRWSFWATITLACVVLAYRAQNFEAAALFLVVASGFFLLPKPILSQREYYRLDGALNPEHSCVHCGARGIWKSTVYKTNRVLNRCSKCKAILFKS